MSSQVMIDGWKAASGTWNGQVTALSQRDTRGITRLYQAFGNSDFVASFQFKLDNAGVNGAGEAKFLYSSADENEDYRIDFMFGSNACRIWAKNWASIWALDLIEGKEYSARVRVRNNIVRVEVDGLQIVSGFNFGRRSDGNIGFGTFDGAVSFSAIEIRPYEERKCFVIMPFDKARNFIYEDVIKPALDSHPEFVFECTRADESLTVGKITEEIDKFIDEANLLIADITAVNANVYYELGYGHAKQRKVLLLAEDGPELSIPFDIKDFRHHRYNFTRDGLDQLKHKIQEIATTILHA
jgi:nucleoside 2-deoxyribosyltransferase